MIRQIPGKIFLSQQRDCKQSSTFRSYRSFNFEEYEDKARKPFGQLYAFNEDTLAAGHSSEIKPAFDSLLILLPLAGFLYCRNSNKNETAVATGEVIISHISRHETFMISNPTKNTLAGYLQILLKRPENCITGSVPLRFSFDLKNNRNMLNDIFSNEAPAFVGLSIGKFSARQKAVYRMKNEGLYAFVLEGEFEVQDRLLHARDGLALWDTDEVDMEALSHEAILLIVDIKLA